MYSTIETLEQAYCLTEEIHQPLTPEIVTIRGMFISVEYITQFGDNPLYLEYIKTLVDERYNISFPDEPGIYRKFFKDSVTLKNLMHVKSDEPGPKEDYFEYIRNLFAQMKTPYYETYYRTVCAFTRSFTEQEILRKTLQSFYSLMIKSTPDKCDLIAIIAEAAPDLKESLELITCRMKDGTTEDTMEENHSYELLLSELLIHHLGVFCMENNFWLVNEFPEYVSDTSGIIRKERTLLRDYLKKEKHFLKQINSEHSKDTLKETAITSDYKTINSQHSKDMLKETAITSDYKTMSLKKNLSSLAGFLAMEKMYFHDNSSKHVEEASAKVPLQKQDISSEFLNTYAYNMNTVNYITNPALCREQEILDLELILISPKKSPILIGDAGTGKTSVVEGLAYRLQRGNVPELLKGKKLFKLTTTSLLSGTKYVGEMEERMKKLTDELSKHPEVILFIDEIHTIVGAGSTESSNNDISNMLKPFIDRGDIKVIGATTRQEYESYLLPDRALSRRFYPIAVDEPDEAATLAILKGTIPAIEYETKVENPYDDNETEEILKTLIEISDPANQPEGQMTRRPELPLTLLEMAFSYAALSSRESLCTDDLILAIRHSNLLSREAKHMLSEGTIFSI